MNFNRIIESRVQRRDLGSDIEVRPHEIGQEIARMESALFVLSISSTRAGCIHS